MLGLRQVVAHESGQERTERQGLRGVDDLMPYASSARPPTAETTNAPRTYRLIRS
jgi:hypothetical protein